ncbi:adenylate/guanylate cyclase [Neiella sp. HB171785]|uniref:Adenylate/guanylate cyclase n=1 Tax=Neiella litorisoli TaxID=2771431 RepID=A0A8J6R2U0_9GAMM|nr:adenylate/guanylate cyclase [Neiella litorisoli]MBD1389500.1 adenylate/guanylate cyclase [Neiella litorisoli]
MLNDADKEELRTIIDTSLDNAERHWRDGGYRLKAIREAALNANDQSTSFEEQPSQIPGHEFVRENETVIDEFVAFVADMRDSTEHLMCAISQKHAEVSGLQRVYYETSALLPALAYVVNKQQGSVTEYLGDGVLALFRVDPDNQIASIYAAHEAAKNAIGVARDLVNDVLKSRYRLPNIDLGVGFAVSKAMVTLVGLSPEKQPKAFGECVFRATKLSGGRNVVICDDKIKVRWPTSKNGRVSFKLRSFNGTNGYIVGSSSPRL